MLLNYIHYKLNEEITAIGGHYVTTKELKLQEADREILVTVGYGVMDTTCCGTGGCAYATVYGFIVEWMADRNAEGFDISHVETINDDQLRQKIKERLMKAETIQQVNFL